MRAKPPCTVSEVHLTGCDADCMTDTYYDHSVKAADHAECHPPPTCKLTDSHMFMNHYTLYTLPSSPVG